MVKAFPKNSDGLVIQAIAVICAGNNVEGSKLFKTLLKKFSQNSIFSKTLSIIASFRAAGFDNVTTNLVQELTQIEEFLSIQTIAPHLSNHQLHRNSKFLIAKEAMPLNISTHASGTDVKGNQRISF